MKLTYPYRLVAQEDGGILVTFPDVPEALTEGATEQEARAMAMDCLIAALGGYVAMVRAIPEPSSEPEAGTVTLPLLVAAKLALYETLRTARWTHAELAKRMGTEERAIGHLVDLDHRSRDEDLARALGMLGKRLVVDVQDAA